MNLTLKLTTEQIIDFLQQMPPEEKLTVLKALAKEARAGRAEQMKYAESKGTTIMCPTRVGLGRDDRR